jgi:hypothetical protein
MTLFDALRHGQEYEEELCPVTRKPHRFNLEIEGEISGGKIYDVLVCKDCYISSLGWKYI